MTCGYTKITGRMQNICVFKCAICKRGEGGGRDKREQISLNEESSECGVELKNFHMWKI